MPRHLRFRLAALAALVAAAVVIAFLVDVPSVATLRTDYAGTGLFGALGFAALYAALTLTPIPATVFTLAAGAVFGVASGAAIAWLGATLGAVVAFYLGRILGRDAIGHLTGARLTSLDAFVDRRGFVAVLVARLIPVVPYSAFNYLSGVTRLRGSHYAVATGLGIVPSIAVYSTLGAYGDKPRSWPFAVALGAVVVLIAVGLWVGRRRRARPAVPAAAATAPAPEARTTTT